MVIPLHRAHCLQIYTDPINATIIILVCVTASSWSHQMEGFQVLDKPPRNTRVKLTTSIESPAILYLYIFHEVKPNKWEGLVSLFVYNMCSLYLC